jgi:hypothetical protein
MPATLTSTMPTPPARLTSLPLSTRLLVPRRQITTRPATWPASSALAMHSAALPPPVPAKKTGAAATALLLALEPATVSAPADVVSTASATACRACVPAATVMIHGMPLSTVLGSGPSLPPAADTRTPAIAALR